MSFLYNVIGDNTPDNIEWMKTIELKRGYVWSDDSPIIGVLTGSYFVDKKESIRGYKKLYNDLIDCCGNPHLFKALTAVRDDSDYMQYFVAHCFLDFTKNGNEECYSAGELFLCKENDVKNLEFSWLRLPEYVPVPFFHKATKEELIKKFKKNKE